VKVNANETYVGTPQTGTWATSDTTIATVHQVSGKLNAIKVGTVTLSYTISNEVPCEGDVSATKEITIVEEVNSSVADIETVSDFTLSPNPTTDIVNVYFYLQTSAVVTIDIVDVNGTIVKSLNMNTVSAGSNQTTLNVSDYAKGVYSVIIRSNDTQATQKLVVIK